MRMIGEPLFAIGFSLGLSASAFALPSLENYADLYAVGDSRSSQGPLANITMFGDNEDPRRLYVPLDAVFLTDPIGGRTRFGLAYDELGGLLSMTVRAGYTPTTQAFIDKKVKEGYRVQPLPINLGSWALTLTDKKGEMLLATTDDLRTVIPTTPVAISTILSDRVIGYVVMAYQTGASLGVNYNYNFRGTITPFRMTAKIHWQSFQKFVSKETRIATQTKVQGCSWLCMIGGSVTLSTQSQVRDVVRRATEKQVIKIKWTGGGNPDAKMAEREAKMIDEVTKVVLAHQFKPMDSQFQPLPAEAPKAECNVSGRFGACFAAARNYAYNSESTFEDREYSYQIESESIINVPGIVGSSFGYLCVDHPELFLHIRTGSQGCPVTWTGTQGIQTTRQTGSQPVMPSDILPTATRYEVPTILSGAGEK